MDSKSQVPQNRLTNVLYSLIGAYGILEGVLLATSVGIWWTTEVDRTKTMMDMGLPITLGVAVLAFAYIGFNGIVIIELFDKEDGARLAFVQTLITTIFVFSLAQAPTVFYTIGLYWCGMSPIGILLSAGVHLVPYVRNRTATTIVGAISAAIGFASKFYTIPFVKEVNIPLTMAGALLTVIGIGSPPPREK